MLDFVIGYRLDFMLFRSNLVKTLFQARYFIIKGVVLVNSKQIISPSFFLKNGDFVNLVINPFYFFGLFTRETFNFSTCEIEVCFINFSFIVIKKTNVNKKVNNILAFFFNFEELKNFNS